MTRAGSLFTDDAISKLALDMGAREHAARVLALAEKLYVRRATRSQAAACCAIDDARAFYAAWDAQQATR